MYRRHAMWSVVLATSALCGAGMVLAESPDEAIPTTSTASVTGALTYLPRIALPPNAQAVVTLLDTRIPGGEAVTEQRIELEDRQVPIPFDLPLTEEAPDEGRTYAVEAAILTGDLLVWVAEPIPVELTEEGQDLGEIWLRQYRPVAFSDEYRCGDQRIRVGTADEWMRLEVEGQEFDLRQRVAASGARFVAIADPATSFWSKGDGARLEVAGRSFPECVRVAADQGLFRASGNEPGWHLEIDADRILVVLDYGERHIAGSAPAPEATDDGLHYRFELEGHDLDIEILDRLCRDSMTGMPHPRAVTVSVDDERLAGCGGDPATLLRGAEWVFEDLGGEALIEGSRVTLNFGDENRVWGKASCNSFLGEYRLTGEQLILSPLATTMMACEQGLMDQEQLFLERLPTVRQFDLDADGRLILHADERQKLIARTEGQDGP